MKSLDIFCASPASTAICSSMDQYTMVRHSMKTHIDRQTQRLGDRLKDPTLIPCSSQLLPFEPKPYNNYQKPRKSSSSSSKEKELRRKSSADISDHLANSSRYLLSDHHHHNEKPMLDFISSSDSSALVPYENHVKDSNNTKEIAVFRSSSTRSCDNYPVYKTSSSVTTKLNDSHVRKSFSTRVRPCDYQVVELRVSIHCKGCEGKVRKHLSRMEGVKSFSIDFPLKKVTVIGDVTPLGVLASISKVKNAAFWQSPTTSSSSSSSSSIYVGRA